MSDALTNLREVLDLHQILRALHALAHEIAPHDRLGVTLPTGDGASLETIAVISRPGVAAPPSARFPLAGSAAGWVAQHRLPFIANDFEELTQFPVTRESMIRDGMRSCCVLPIDTGERQCGMLFLLARARSVFNSMHLPGLGAAAKLVEGVLAAQRALDAFSGAAGIAQDPAPTLLHSECKLPTLEDVQRNYIEAILDRTSGVVEGERGAATLLGIAPSTLRHKMYRLDIRKPGG